MRATCWPATRTSPCAAPRDAADRQQHFFAPRPARAREIKCDRSPRRPREQLLLVEAAGVDKNKRSRRRAALAGVLRLREARYRLEQPRRRPRGSLQRQRARPANAAAPSSTTTTTTHQRQPARQLHPSSASRPPAPIRSTTPTASTLSTTIGVACAHIALSAGCPPIRATASARVPTGEGALGSIPLVFHGHAAGLVPRSSIVRRSSVVRAARRGRLGAHAGDASSSTMRSTSAHIVQTADHVLLQSRSHARR